VLTRPDAWIFVLGNGVSMNVKYHKHNQKDKLRAGFKGGLRDSD
jgi:hypothetical protein